MELKDILAHSIIHGFKTKGQTILSDQEAAYVLGMIEADGDLTVHLEEDLLLYYDAGRDFVRRNRSE